VYSWLRYETTFSTASNVSVLEELERRYNNVSFEYTRELRDTGAGGAGSDRIIIYRKDEDYVTHGLIEPYQEQPAVRQLMGETVAAFGRFAPVKFVDLRPVRYMDVTAVAP
jgi:hypothetical protein